MQTPPPRTDGLNFFYWVPPGGYAYQMWTKKRFAPPGEEYEFFGETERVSFLMDTELGVMLKHGPHESCHKEFMRYANRGVARDMSLAIITFPERYDVEEINRCLSTAGYLFVLAKREGLIL